MSNTQEQTVFIIDDDEAVRDSIKELLESVGLQAECYDSALAFLDAFNPDRPGCIVLDVRMAEMGGLVLQSKLRDLGFTTPVIVITGHGDVPMAVQAMKNGAVDFIQKPYRDQLLLDSINSALEQDAATRHLSTVENNLNQHLAELTEREKEVLTYLQAGRTAKEIARVLSISPRTAEAHRRNLLHKLGVSSAKELILHLTPQKERNQDS
jgi:FixJ family two-component response regulator